MSDEYTASMQVTYDENDVIDAVVVIDFDERPSIEISLDDLLEGEVTSSIGGAGEKMMIPDEYVGDLEDVALFFEAKAQTIRNMLLMGRKA